ncbi:MAG: ABC transporter ATP-binding protein [Dehalococcoidia bacterium]|nr:ABC transporter ATP-binding protein [Dehalococcoidia bacterium]
MVGITLGEDHSIRAVTQAPSGNSTAAENGQRPVVLELDGLRAHFATPQGIVKAVDGVNWDVREGETVALVGESGSGKSVTALGIMGLISPPGKITGGRILFGGRDLAQLSQEEMRNIRGHQIAMVFQEPMTSLNPVLTVRRQMTEGMEVHLKMRPKEASERAIELLTLVGIPDAKRRMHEYPHHFSGGMRQRVMIAQALSCNPKVILADEPTTALDVTIQAQVLEVMEGLAHRFNTATVIITHNLGVVARYARRVNVMYAGRLVETGNARDIYTNPQHPYTYGLLQSVPRLNEPRKTSLIPIEGSPPDLARLPQGCAFRPRCRFAVERCGQETPLMALVGPAHAAACWVAASPGGLPK